MDEQHEIDAPTPPRKVDVPTYRKVDVPTSFNLALLLTGLATARTPPQDAHRLS
jgi:hypothetical protein